VDSSNFKTESKRNFSFLHIPSFTTWTWHVDFSFLHIPSFTTWTWHVVICRIREAGVKFPSVGLGSTPTASQPSALMKDVNELHPGNYVFYGRTRICCWATFGLLQSFCSDSLHLMWSHFSVDCVGWASFGLFWSSGANWLHLLWYILTGLLWLLCVWGGDYSSPVLHAVCHYLYRYKKDYFTWSLPTFKGVSWWCAAQLLLAVCALSCHKRLWHERL